MERPGLESQRRVERIFFFTEILNFQISLKKILKKVLYKNCKSRKIKYLLLFYFFFWITNRFGKKIKYIFKNWIELEFLVILEYYLDKKDLRKYNTNF